MREISYQDEVEQAVWKVGTGKLIVAASLYRNKLNSIPELTFYKSLERMVERRKLNRLSRGIYYRAGITDGEDALRSEIIHFYTGSGEKTITGFFGGEKALIDWGILSRCETSNIIYSNRMTQKRKKVCGIEIYAYPDVLNTNQLPYAQLVEMVNGLEQYCDRDDFSLVNWERFLKSLWDEYDDKRMIRAVENFHIPQRKLAFLVKTIEESGHFTKLRERLPGTSRYRILELHN